MTSFGVTDDGFSLKTLEDTVADLEDKNRTSFGAGINQSATSVIGQLNGTYAEPVAELWELALAVYRAGDPNNATGDALDAICAITGVVRLAATSSTVTLALDLDASTTVPAARVVSASGNPSARFITQADVTSTTAGTYTVAAVAESVGPVTAVAGSLTVIETPVTGWNSVTNTLDAVPGRALETDSELRLRRALTLTATGAATVDAIAADISAVSGVTEVLIFENETDLTDSNGVPPHAFEAVVRGGTDGDVAQAIWDSKAAGIATSGSTTATATDSQGGSRTINFSRPTVVNIYVAVTLTTNSSYDAVNGPAAVKAAIVAAMEDPDTGLRIGDDVIQTRIYAPIFGVTGVIDVPHLYIGTSPSPASVANITIAARELADFDTGRITVA